jgi:hypothetical protein
VDDHRLLRFILRLFGTSSLFALIFVAAPFGWMDAIHARLGMGELPDAPVVGYLARSTSAFYALFGGLLWVLSFDLVRHRVVLMYLAFAIVGFGVALFAIDSAEGMPVFWRFWEGPMLVALGVTLVVLVRRVK